MGVLMNENVDFQDLKESEFDTSLASGYRIHYQLLDCNKFSRAGDLFNWLIALHILQREISPLLSTAENLAIDKIKNSSASALNAFVVANDKQGAVSQCYFVLDMYEKELRNLANKHGVLFRIKDTLLRGLR